MNTYPGKLALRRQSIRTLSPSELRVAHGGYDAWGNQSGSDTGRDDGGGRGDDRNPRAN